jgi:hypothetical protein
MRLLFKARCRIIEHRYRIVQSQFDAEPGHEWIGEYAYFNLLRERGELIDGAPYRIEIIPLLPRLVKG